MRCLLTVFSVATLVGHPRQTYRGFFRDTVRIRPHLLSQSCHTAYPLTTSFPDVVCQSTVADLYGLQREHRKTLLHSMPQEIPGWGAHCSGAYLNRFPGSPETPSKVSIFFNFLVGALGCTRRTWQATCSIDFLPCRAGCLHCIS